MLTEILVPIIVFLGLVVGYILALIAPEEVHPYQKHLAILKTIFLTLSIISLIVSVILPETTILFYTATLIYLIFAGIKATTNFVLNDKIKHKFKALLYVLKTNWWGIIVCFIPTIISTI